MIRHVLNISGGKDSTAMYLLALEKGIEFTPVFADTGNEHAITYEYLAQLPYRTGGPDIIRVKADFESRIRHRRRFVALDRRKRGVRYTNKAKRRILTALAPSGIPFLDLCLWKGRFPSTKMRFCTSELKQIPIFTNVFIPILEAGHLVMSWQGSRAQESLARSRLPVRDLDPNDSGIINYRPLLAWDHNQVFDMHKRHGLEPNPLYKMGFSRVGCMPCIHAAKREIRTIHSRFPEEIERIRIWEEMVSRVSKIGKSTFFALDKTPYADRPGVIDTVVDWSKTVWGGRQYSLPFPLPACHSLYGLCE